MMTSPATPFDLTGRLVVVTGCRRGIGFAMAEALARAGADYGLPVLPGVATPTDIIAALASSPHCRRPQPEESLAAAAAGGGCMVFVLGEAGIGKSSLVREFGARHATDTVVFWGACEALRTRGRLPRFMTSPGRPAVSWSG